MNIGQGGQLFGKKTNTTYWPKKKAQKMTNWVLAWEVGLLGVYAELSPYFYIWNKGTVCPPFSVAPFFQVYVEAYLCPLIPN